MICEAAANKSNVGQIKKVINDVLTEFKVINPEGLACRNGVKLIKPAR